MIQKLKEKIKIFQSRFILLFCILVVGFFTTHKASATAYDLQSINLTFNIQVGTSTNPSSLLQQKFVRVGSDGTLVIRGLLSLNSPQTINAGKDEINALGAGGVSGLLDYLFNGNTIITGFGLGLIPADPANPVSGGSAACKTVYSAYNFLSCDFLKRVDNPGGVNASAGNVFLDQSFKISGSDFAALGMTPSSNPNGATYYLLVYPYLSTESKDLLTSNPKPAVFGNAGQRIIVQLYQTQTMADAANQQYGTQPPTGLPGYSSTSGSPTSNDSSTLLSLFNQLIGIILGFLQEVIYTVFSLLIAPIIQAMLSIHVYKDTFVAVIYPGWEVIRNICNIFFIVALIIIAMATLFRIESYQYKHLLVQLIIAALLINFSLVIAQAVLGLADTVQAQFLPANATVIKSLAGDLMVTYRKIYWDGGVAPNNLGSFSATVQPLFYLSLSLGTFFVFLAIAAFLFIRIVALWILLMISPIAYAVGVLPSTEHYRKEWWDQFLKYAFFTPIMAFFLNMAAVIVVSYQNTPILQQYADTQLKNDLGGSNIADFVFKVGSNILLLIFLIAGLKVAEQAGIYGASAITSFAEKGIFAPFALAKVGAERAFEGVQNIAGVDLDPRSWAAKWKEYSEREKHKRLEKRADTDFLGIPGTAKIGLGSPLDFFKNYANWQAVKRMKRNIGWRRTKAAFDNMQHSKEGLDLLRSEGNIMTDPQFTAAQTELAGANQAYANMLADARTALSQKNDFEDELSRLETQETTPGAAVLTDDEKRRMQALRAKISEREKALAKMGAAKFSEDPITHRETLIEDFAQDTQLKLAQVQAQELQAKVDDDQKKLGDYRNKTGNQAYSRQTQAERDQLTNRLKTATKAFNEAQTAYFSRRLPEAYHARAARQHLEAEEEKKVSDIKSWPEKVQVFLSAQAEQNPYLAAAVLKSLAKDSNFNEIVEALGYSSSAEGLKQLMEVEYKKKFGLTDHQMMQVATEIGYVNEDAGWWNMARVSDIDHHGHLNWQIDTSGNGEWRRTVAADLNHIAINQVTAEQMKAITEQQLLDAKPEDINVAGINATTAYNQKWAPQNNEISVEMEKRGARLIANFARTSFVNQTLGPEGHMTTGIHAAGKRVLQSMSKTQNTIYEFSRMLRSNTAKAIASAHEWDWAYCKQNGIDREIYEKITKMAGKPLDPVN